MTILKEAVQAVTQSRGVYEKADAYYEGDTPEVFGSALFARTFGRRGYHNRLNYCRPVVNAVVNRLEIAAVIGVSEEANRLIGETWEINQLGLDAKEIHRAAVVFGDAFVMVWPDEKGNLEISYNSPLTTALVYDPEHPKRKMFAVKMWEDAQGTRLNLYYPGRILKYRTDSKGVVAETADWTLLESLENPFGEVPVFHFRTHRPFGRPEHRDMYEAQDYINKQFVTSMIVTDYMAAPQRYALTRENADNTPDDYTEGDTERENSGALKTGPGEVWFMEGIEKVGEFKPAEPDNFWKPIKETVRAGASITDTPLHFFDRTGNIPSGEALRTAEAPLIKKVKDRQASFGQTWRELFRFVLLAYGIDEDVQVKWIEAESLGELDRWDLALKKRNAGVSLAEVLRELDYDEEVIVRVVEEARLEREKGDVAGYERQVRVETQNDERNVDG